MKAWVIIPLIIAIAALTGCDNPAMNNRRPAKRRREVELVTDVDFVTENGVEVALSDSGKTHLWDYEIDEALTDTQECMGEVLEYAPFVVMSDETVNDMGPPIQGLAYFETGMIEFFVANGHEWDRENIKAVMRHEFVHLVLKQQGMSNEDNSNHNSVFFECGYPMEK